MKNELIKNDDRIFYSDRNQVFKECFLKKHTFDSSGAGVGKTHKTKQEIIKNPEKTYLIIGRNHKFLKEFHDDLEMKEIESEHILGFTKMCPKYKKNNLIGKLYDQKYHPYTICLLDQCGNTEECEYKKQWQSIKDEDGNIIKTILIPPELLPVFDFSQFTGDIIIEEDCSKVEFSSKYNKEDIKSELSKIKDYSHEKLDIICEIIDSFIKALDELDVSTMYKLYKNIDEIIHDYNVSKITEHINKTKYDNVTEEKNIAQIVCKLRVSEIVLFCDFQKRKHDKKKDWRISKWKREVEGAYREFKTLDIEFGGREHEDEVKEYLKEEKIDYIKHLMEFAESNDIQIPKIDFDDDVYEILDCLGNITPTSVKKSIWNEKLTIGFDHYVMFKHMNSHKHLHSNDTTFSERLDIYIQRIIQFKELFPEYKFESRIIEKRYKSDSCFHIPALIDARFTKINFIDDMLKHEKHIRNRITHLKNQGKKVCILTFQKIKDEKGNEIPIIKNGKFLGVPAFHYGMAGGINAYEDFDVLLVIGTYLPDRKFFTKYWYELYRDYGDMPGIKWTPTKNRELKLNNPYLQKIYDSLWLPDYIYNAIYRTRPSRHHVDVYCYCWNIPQMVKDGMKMRTF